MRILGLVLMVMTFPCNGVAQTKEALVGTWKLLSVTDTTDKGEIVENVYGPNPIGFITYTADGRMMVIITDGRRKPLSNPDWRDAPAEERAEAFSTLVAYAGSYTFTGDKVIHHIEAAWRQNAVNTNFVRIVLKIDSNRLTLRRESVVTRGVHFAHEDLVWERMKAETTGR